MASDDARLLVRIEATQRQFEKQLASMNKSARRSTQRYERDFKQANRRVAESFRPMGSAIAAVTAGLGTRNVIQYADAWTAASNKIAAASQISGMQARSMTDLNDLADDTRAGLTETVDLYAKLLRATSNFVTTEEDIARATLITNKAFIAGGAAATERRAGILQLGQALGSSFLQGDELRSIRENAPLLAQAIANEFETTIGGLKDLGAEGKLTSERVYRAILNGQTDIEAAFAQTDATISDGFTRVKNALIEYIAAGDDSIGATKKLVSALGFLADHIDKVGVVVALLAGRGVAVLAGRLLANLLPALLVASRALDSFAVSGTVAAGSLNVLKAAMAIIGGPVGLALSAAAAGAYLLSRNTSDAVVYTELLAESASDVERAFGKAGGEVGKIAENLEALTLTQAITQAGKLGDALDDAIDDFTNKFGSAIDNQIESLSNRPFSLFGGGADNSGLISQLEQIRDLEVALKDGTVTIDQFRESLRNIARNTADDQIRRVADAALDGSGEIKGLTDKAQQANDILLILSGTSEQAAAAAGRLGLSMGDAAESAANLSNQASSATNAIGTLVSMIPRLNAAARQTENLAKATQAYEEGLRAASGEVERLTLLANFEEAKREINGTAEATRSATSALDQYLGQSHLNALDARSRAIEIERQSFADLEAQIKGTAGAEQKLTEARAAHASNLAVINESFASNGDSGGGGGGGAGIDAEADQFSGNDTIDQLKFEIELIGKTASEIAALTFQYQALREAKREGVDLDKIQIETGKSLRDTIDAEAASIAKLTLEAEQYNAQSEFMASATQSLKDGLIDAILEGKNFGSVLSDLGKQIAKAALQAALFGQGPLAALFGTSPGKGGGGLLGGLGFANGGYTGDGGKYQPAGIVHKGEYVFDKESTSRIGVHKLESFRRNLRGYSSGGLVGPAPSISANQAGFSPNISVEPAPVEIVYLDNTDSRFESFLQSARGENSIVKAMERNRA